MCPIEITKILKKGVITGEIGSTASRSGSWERRLAIASAFLALSKTKTIALSLNN